MIIKDYYNLLKISFISNIEDFLTKYNYQIKKTISLDNPLKERWSECLKRYEFLRIIYFMKFFC